MEKLKFGISGLPLGDGSRKFNYASGIEYVSAIGLDALELLFVRSVNVTDKNCGDILAAKIKHKVYLSASRSIKVLKDNFNIKNQLGLNPKETP